MRQLLFTILLVGAGISVTSSPAHACTLITAGNHPDGWGAAHNLFSSAGELILGADCTIDAFTPEAGSSLTDETNFAVYSTGYYYGGSEWEPITYTPVDGAAQYGPWILGDAAADAGIAYQDTNTFFATYTCHWDGSDWNCGCQDEACDTPSWQLQAVRDPNVPDDPSTGPGGGGGGDGGGTGICQVGGETLAFPGAQGFGRFASGGRGGDVVFVTNTDDSGPGSLRRALSGESGPRTVIFRTSGVIDLSRNINVPNGDLTIAGQTSPNGITLRGASIKLNTSNVIMRGLRMRPGDGPGHSPSDRDAFGISGSNNSSNIIVDHNSITWGVDENATIRDGTANITFSNNIIAEALYDSIHPKGRRAKNLMVAERVENVTLYRNLIANGEDRGPLIWTPTENVEVVNNYIYDHARATDIRYICEQGGASGPVRIVNNLYEGPAYQGRPFIRNWAGRQGVSCDFRVPLHVTGNMSRSARDVGPERSAPGAPTGIDSNAVISADAVGQSLLGTVGARWPTVDTVDRRIFNYVARGDIGRGNRINSPSDVGGYPSVAPGTPPRDSDNDGIPDSIEPQVGGDPNRYDSDEVTGNGYTRLELFINGIISGDFGQCS